MIMKMEKNKIGFIIGIILSILLIIGIIFLFVAKKVDIGIKKSVTYKVLFDSNGGSEVDEQNIKNGEFVKRPNDPIKNGSLFIEWDLDDKLYDFSSKVDSDIKLKAKWKEIDNNQEVYLVKFDSDGGSTLSNLVVNKGEKIGNVKIPVREGYKFVGWMIDGNLFNFDQGIYSNIELKARWLENGAEDSKLNDREEFIVNFDSNGGEILYSVKVRAGERVNKPTDPVRNGYKFKGWFLNNNLHDFNISVNMNITLVAMWEEGVVDNSLKHTITYDSNGGSEVAAQEVVSGTEAIPPEVPTRKGYIFKRWNLYGSEYKFNKKVTDDITLVAEWKKTYVVNYYSKDRLYSSQTVEEGLNATSTPAPKNDGYIFKGWTLDGTSYDFSTPVMNDITLIALWKKAFKVEFDSSLKGIVDTQTVAEGERATAPNALKKYENYIFYTWFYEGKKYEFNNLVYKDMHIVAGWSYVFDSPNCDSCGNVGVSILNEDVLEVETEVTTKEGDVPTSFEIKIIPKSIGTTKFTLKYADNGYGTYVVEIKEDMVPKVTECAGKYCFV